MCENEPPTDIPKTSKFYSRYKTCDIEKTLGVGYHPPPLGSPKVNIRISQFNSILDHFPKPGLP